MHSAREGSHVGEEITPEGRSPTGFWVRDLAHFFSGPGNKLPSHASFLNKCGAPGKEAASDLLTLGARPKESASRILYALSLTSTLIKRFLVTLM
jgi:hypothetical protein